MQTIQTERLTLRKFRDGDAPALLAYLEAPTAGCFLSLKLADLAAAEIEVSKRAAEDGYIAVCLKQTGEVIGDLFAHVEEDPFAAVPDTISVGWNFNPAFSGKGYAFESAKAFLAQLFQEQNARRIYAYVEDHNVASQRLCEKLGMRREGMFLEYVTFMNDADGRPIYENTMQYAILRREWEAHAQGA